MKLKLAVDTEGRLVDTSFSNTQIEAIVAGVETCWNMKTQSEIISFQLVAIPKKYEK